MTDAERFPLSAWQADVAAGTTQASYVDWLDAKLDAECVAAGVMSASGECAGLAPFKLVAVGLPTTCVVLAADGRAVAQVTDAHAHRLKAIQFLVNSANHHLRAAARRPQTAIARDVLERLLDYVESYREDFQTGIEVGIYDDTEENKAKLAQLTKDEAAFATHLKDEPVERPADWPVRHFLDLSTAHLSEETRTTLDRWGWLSITEGPTSPTCADTGYGWFVHAEDERSDGVPDDLWSCMEEARKRGCDYLLFDRDADMIDGLPTFPT